MRMYVKAETTVALVTGHLRVEDDTVRPVLTFSCHLVETDIPT